MDEDNEWEAELSHIKGVYVTGDVYEWLVNFIKLEILKVKRECDKKSLEIVNHLGEEYKKLVNIKLKL